MATADRLLGVAGRDGGLAPALTVHVIEVNGVSYSSKVGVLCLCVSVCLCLCLWSCVHVRAWVHRDLLADRSCARVARKFERESVCTRVLQVRAAMSCSPAVFACRKYSPEVIEDL